MTAEVGILNAITQHVPDSCVSGPLTTPLHRGAN